MNLYMVRHGQTADSRENRFSGSSDPPLTMVGEAMVQAFADPLCRLTGVQGKSEDGLKEIDYGEWEGLRQAEVKQRWPEAFENAVQSTWWCLLGATAVPIASSARIILI